MKNWVQCVIIRVVCARVESVDNIVLCNSICFRGKRTTQLTQSFNNTHTPHPPLLTAYCRVLSPAIVSRMILNIVQMIL